jgi:hypothetical protein
MINFFRKTRKKLADDHKFIKYSRYAVEGILFGGHWDFAFDRKNKSNL